MRLASSIIEVIGGTPLVRIAKFRLFNEHKPWFSRGAMCHNRARNRGLFRSCDAAWGEALQTKIYNVDGTSKRSGWTTWHTDNTLNLGGFRLRYI